MDSGRDGAPAVTVPITTRNRRHDLRRALAVAVVQEGDLDVLVVDDGSTDGPAAMATAEFPEVRLVGFEAPAVPRRNTEELGYWTQMRDVGYVTCFSTGLEIHHHESPRRVVADVVYYDCRNNLLHAWRNAPSPHAVARAAKLFGHALGVVARRTGPQGAVGRGLATGLAPATRARGERWPVRRATYRAGLPIRYAVPRPLAALQALLPGPACRP